MSSLGDLTKGLSIFDLVKLAEVGTSFVMRLRAERGQPLDPAITAEEIRSAAALIEHEDDILGPAPED